MEDGNDSSLFLGDSANIGESDNDFDDPVELIISRVIFALIVTISIVLNLLLFIAIIRRRQSIHVIYILVTSMFLPDLIFFTKLIIELMNWNSNFAPNWSNNNTMCAFWQFASHFYPLLYSGLLVCIVYHAFVTLFLDYSGSYEESTKRLLPLILIAVYFFVSVIVSPSAFYSTTLDERIIISRPSSNSDYCDLVVPSITTTGKIPEIMKIETRTIYKLVYEIILPYILPLILIGFPYVCILVGLMRSVPAASHSDHLTKLSVVFTLWLITTYLMLHVTTIMNNVFTVFDVWNKLMNLFDAHGDRRIPKFRSYIRLVAYFFTCLWTIIRSGLCFKYNYKLRKALGP